jgi:hypothetical protein
MDSSPVILALIAIVGTIVAGLFKLLNDNTKALIALVEETRTGNREAKERNGHLGEQNIQLGEQNTQLATMFTQHTEAAAQTAGEIKDLLTPKGN